VPSCRTRCRAVDVPVVGLILRPVATCCSLLLEWSMTLSAVLRSCAHFTGRASSRFYPSHLGRIGKAVRSRSDRRPWVMRFSRGILFIIICAGFANSLKRSGRLAPEVTSKDHLWNRLSIFSGKFLLNDCAASRRGRLHRDCRAFRRIFCVLACFESGGKPPHSIEALRAGIGGTRSPVHAWKPRMKGPSGWKPDLH
jgi:hypothetical protein